MVFTAKIPSLVTRYLSSASGPRSTMVGEIARVVVVSRIARTVTRGLGKRPTGRRTAANASTDVEAGSGGPRRSGRPDRRPRAADGRSGGPGRTRPPIAEGSGRERVNARRSGYQAPRRQPGPPLPPPPRNL